MNEVFSSHCLFPLVPILAVLLAALAFFSFTAYSPEETGELYAAVSALGDTLAENEAIAVFLGITEEEAAKERIREEAERYIAEQNEALG